MKWYINEYYSGYPVVTITRRLFYIPGCKRYARHVKPFNSFATAVRYLKKINKGGFAKDFVRWISNKPIED